MHVYARITRSRSGGEALGRVTTACGRTSERGTAGWERAWATPPCRRGSAPAGCPSPRRGPTRPAARPGCRRSASGPGTTGCTRRATAGGAACARAAGRASRRRRPGGREAFARRTRRRRPRLATRRHPRDGDCPGAGLRRGSTSVLSSCCPGRGRSAAPRNGKRLANLRDEPSAQ